MHTPIPHPPSLHFLQSLILIKLTIMTTATAFWKNGLTWLVCSAVTSLHQSPGPSAAMPCHTQRAAGNCARFAVPVPFPLWEIPTFVRFSSSSLLLLDMASISSACCHSLASSTCICSSTLRKSFRVWTSWLNSTNILPRLHHIHTSSLRISGLYHIQGVADDHDIK